MKRILIVPPMPWYMTNHFEYLIRALGDEFFIEIAQVPYPPYENFVDRYPETSPLMRSPNDYDLIVPILGTHWGVTDDYAHKIALIMYEPGEGKWEKAAFIASTTPEVEKGTYNKPVYPVRFGVDTEIYKPYKLPREDNLLHVGVIGTLNNPRRMIEEAVKPLYDLGGVRILFFPTSWENDGGTRERIDILGGMEFVKRCVAGEKTGVGLANLYNRMDVLLRVDSSYGLSFPTLEAAACGVPVIVTDMGIDRQITEAGGGILIDGNPREWLNKPQELRDKVREAVIFMRDHPQKRKKMGQAGRLEVLKNWQWDDKIPAWRKFFRTATQ